jgi:hypothetical protein
MAVKCIAHKIILLWNISTKTNILAIRFFRSILSSFLKTYNIQPDREPQLSIS